MKSYTPQAEAHDLDLLPIMNLFSILIPFLLSVAVFQKIAIVPTSMPERGDPPASEPIDFDQSLGLSLFLTQTSIKLWAWDQPYFEMPISWDEGSVVTTPELQTKLLEIYNRGIDMHDSEEAILVAEYDVTTQGVIQLMDALKESGFHQIQLAQLGAP